MVICFILFEKEIQQIVSFHEFYRIVCTSILIYRLLSNRLIFFYTDK